MVTLTLTLDKPVSGTMIVIVSNLEGTRQEVAGKAPKLGRVLIFSFSSSTVGTCSSSFGELKLLQLPFSDYKLLAASLSNYNVTIPSNFAISSVTPTLLVASCVLDSSGTEVELSFSGFGIPKGMCTLILNGSITLEVSFSDDSFGRSEGSMRKGVSGKDGDLSEKTEYSVTGIVSQANSSASIAIASGVRLNVPTAARLSKVSVSDFLDARKTKVKLSFQSMKLEANKKYILKMKRADTSEETVTREMLTDENGVLSDVDEILYPYATESEERKEQLEFGDSYGVLSLTASGRTRSVLISDIVVKMPDEPPRIFALVSHSLNGKKDQLTLSFQAALLPDGEGVIKVKQTDIDILVEGVVTRDSATQCTAMISTAWTEDTTHLSFRKIYSVQSATIESVDVAIDSEMSFEVPNPPRITSVEYVFVNSLQSMCKIRVRGTDLVAGTEYEVVLDDLIRLTVTFKTSMEGESEGVSIGKNGKLKHNRTYTLTEMKPIREDDGWILLPEIVLLRIGERTTINVIVREGGSDKREECGTIRKPCESVLIGWRVGEDEGVSGVVVKIDGCGGFGGRVVVGERNVEIGGLFAKENELKVESVDLGKDGEDGVVSVSGGRVVIVGVRLILPSGWEMGEKRVGSVLCGFGECVILSVSIVSGWKGEEIGMGLVSWMGGSLSVEKIVMEGVEMSAGQVLVNCSSLKKEVSFEMESSRFIEVGTRNAELVRFSSKLKESHIGIRDCVFVSTQRVESRKVGDGMGVIVIETSQEKTEISKCVFSDCGTVEGTRGSTKKGGVLAVTVGNSNRKEKREIVLLGNVFVDSSVSWEGNQVEKRGGVAVWSVEGSQLIVDLLGNWFEETSVSGVVFDRDRFGVPIIERKRKVVHSLSRSGHAGLVVVVGRVLPVIRRVGSSFSGCSLRMVSLEGGELMKQNADEL